MPANSMSSIGISVSQAVFYFDVTLGKILLFMSVAPQSTEPQIGWAPLYNIYCSFDTPTIQYLEMYTFWDGWNRNI